MHSQSRPTAALRSDRRPSGLAPSVLCPVYGATCPGLPTDFINFHHDPLACAIALGWDVGVNIETVPLKFEVHDTYLYETPDTNGRPTRLVTQIDAQAFNAYWVDVITR